MADMIEICGAWKKQGRTAKYYSGQVKNEIVIPAGSYVTIFQNADATEENRKPPLRVLFSPPEGAPQRQEPAQDYGPQRQAPARQGGRMADDLDDSIPFAASVL